MEGKCKKKASEVRPIKIEGVFEVEVSTGGEKRGDAKRYSFSSHEEKWGRDLKRTVTSEKGKVEETNLEGGAGFYDRRVHTFLHPKAGEKSRRIRFAGGERDGVLKENKGKEKKKGFTQEGRGRGRWCHGLKSREWKGKSLKTQEEKKSFHDERQYEEGRNCPC